MRSGEPSRTAFGAAVHRAMHQDLEAGRVFADSLAWRILGADRDVVRAGYDADLRRPLRLFIAVRHRFAEDAVAAAHRRGVRQVVVLGAGLDTFGYRNPWPDLAVWEVDHPDTGEWKRARLVDAGIEVPASVRYVGVDFERDDLVGRLTAGGLDAGSPTTFLWLGVVPYLTAEAVTATLRSVGSLPGAEVVLDYPTPDETHDPDLERMREDLRRRTEAAGEPLRSAFATDEMATLLTRAGFDEIEDLGRREFVPRYLGVAARAGGDGGHVVRARRTTTL